MRSLNFHSQCLYYDSSDTSVMPLHSNGTPLASATTGLSSFLAIIPLFFFIELFDDFTWRTTIRICHSIYRLKTHAHEQNSLTRELTMAA